MPTIRLRKDKRFEMRFYYNKKQYSVYSKDPSELQKKYTHKLKELKQKKKQQQLEYKQPLNYTLKEWTSNWINIYKKPFVSYETLCNIEIYFKKHIFPTFENFNLKDITIEHIQPFLNKMPKTRTKELVITYFNACLKKAKDLDYIVKNPFDLVVKDKKLKNIRPAFDIYAQETILTHIKKNNYEFYKLILFYISTGVRRKEALTINSNDFNNNLLHIKGTKTVLSDRTIKITDKLKQLIFKDGIIFNYKEDYVTNKFKEYLRELNINGTLHCLRHTYATNQYYLGTPAKEVQLNMGHSEINITLDIYTNIKINDNKQETINKIKTLYNDYYIELQN